MEEQKQNDSKVEESKETENVKEKASPNTEETKPESKKQKNKKLIYGIIAAIAVIVICIGAYAYSEKQRKQELLDSIQITFVDELTIEYGTKDFDFNKLIKEKTDEVILPKQIDTMKIGEVEVIYKVEKEGVSKEFPIKINVTDTKAPEIKIKKDIVTIEYGKEYDIKSNIESVKDPVDGDVPYKEKAGDYNYYTVEGTVDTAKAGDYTITIKAVDKNKNKSEKTYTVHVEEKEVEQPVYKPNSGGSSNTNAGGNTYTPPVNNGGGNSTSTPPATTCQANGQWKSTGNSGVAFYTWEEADAWAVKNWGDHESYAVVTVHDVCGNEGWSVSWD